LLNSATVAAAGVAETGMASAAAVTFDRRHLLRRLLKHHPVAIGAVGIGAAAGLAAEKFKVSPLLRPGQTGAIGAVAIAIGVNGAVTAKPKANPSLKLVQSAATAIGAVATATGAGVAVTTKPEACLNLFRARP
jgi:hypothetical protein